MFKARESHPYFVLLHEPASRMLGAAPANLPERAVAAVPQPFQEAAEAFLVHGPPRLVARLKPSRSSRPFLV